MVVENKCVGQRVERNFLDDISIMKDFLDHESFLYEWNTTLESEEDFESEISWMDVANPLLLYHSP